MSSPPGEEVCWQDRSASDRVVFVLQPNETSRATDEAGLPAARPLDVRRHNLSLLLQHVGRGGRVSRAALARRTGLTKGTVSVLVQELLAAGLLQEHGPQASGQIGRPGTALGLNGNRLCGLGLDIGVDYLAVCATDLLDRVRYQRIETADNRAAGPGSTLDRAARLVTGAAEAIEREGLTAAGVGVAVPGMLRERGGRLVVAPNLGWSDLRVTDEVARRLARPGLPIHADNEANLAALAELWLGDRGAQDSYVYVFGQVGIGAGIVMGGRLVRGARGFAGEIGHVVVDPGGPTCACGGRGCLERMAGQEAILADAGLPTTAATSVGHSESPIPELVARLEAGDPTATAAVERAGAALGIALADVVNVIDVDTVVLGGMYAPLAPWLTDALESELDRQVIGASERDLRLQASALGPDAAVRGAAAWVVQRILAEPPTAAVA